MEATVDLQTWEEAFEKYPISTTRAIEKQLRSNAANNRDKLRILVGGNYRELLSTAEQIVALEGQTKAAESHISDIGQRCHPPSHQKTPDPKAPRRRLLGQLRLLQRCILVVKSVLGRGDLLQSAQLLVVARLLLKSLGEDDINPTALQALRERVASLRRQVLRRVDNTLANPHSALDIMVRSCCSYCLMTSSSFQDVFRHVSRLRMERLRKSLDHDQLLDRHIIDALRYYAASLHLLGDLNGRPMLDALGNLQKRPILQEPRIVDVDLLGLNGLSTPIPEEIQSFVPYFKRTPFATHEIQEALLAWSSDASPILTQGIERLMLEQTDITAILSLRKELFSILLPGYFGTPGSSEMHQTLRRVLGKRVGDLIQLHIDALERYGEQVSNLASPDSTMKGLWEDDLARMRLEGGADAFLSQVHKRRRGTSTLLARNSRSFSTWIVSAKTLMRTFQELKNVRWRDVIEEPDDEQEEEAEDVVRGLTKEDPEQFLLHLRDSLHKGSASLEKSMVERISRNMEPKAGAQLAVEYLRFMREVIMPMHQAFPQVATFQGLNALISHLHQVIAKEVVDDVCESSNDTSTQKGEQFIDGVPSPSTFDFLRRLCTLMSELGGTDIWSPAAVQVLKSAVAERVFDSADKHKHVDRKFDEEYLKAALAPTSTSDNELEDQAKAAREYWNRTRLLFGILGD